jgi:hypothetical protein
MGIAVPEHDDELEALAADLARFIIGGLERLHPLRPEISAEGDRGKA